MNTELMLALDVETYEEAKAIIDSLDGMVKVYKVGGILYLRDGNRTIEYIKSKNCKVFLDLKFFDIPNTVKGVTSQAAALGVDFFTIHLLGGAEMIRQALEGAEKGASRAGGRPPLLLGVTVLTSMSAESMQNDWNQQIGLPEMVKHLARNGYDNGMRGFVCSPHEITLMRGILGNGVTLVTPGVRRAGEAAGDQKRIMTPAMAAELGSSYIVMGRSIIDAPDRKTAVLEINRELNG